MAVTVARYRLMELRARLIRYRFPLLSSLTALAVLALHLAPILSVRGQLAGWDTPGHQALAEQMLELLREGKLSAYVTSWFAGYPAFVLYPPITSLLLALPAWFTDGAISIGTAMLVLNAVLPFLFLLSFWWTSRQWFGDAAARWAPLVSLIYLTLPNEIGVTGAGLAGQLRAGLVPHALGTVLYTAFLGVLADSRAGVVRVLSGTLLLAALLLTHLLSAALALFTLLLWSLWFRWTALWRALLMGGGATLLASWWLLPFFAHLSMSAAAPLGLPGWIHDPLQIWLPDLSAERMAALRSVPRVSLEIANVPLSVPTALVGLPWVSLLVLVGVPVGMYAVAGSDAAFLTLLLTAAALLLPRDYLPGAWRVPLHGYRFAALLWVPLALLLVRGVPCVLAAVVQRRGVRRLLAAAVLGGIVVIAGARFSLVAGGAPGESFDDPRASWIYRFDTARYPEQHDATSMMLHIAALPAGSRVAIEPAYSLIGRVGSPHLISSQLAATTSLELLPGLVAESSALAPFIIPTLAARSEGVRWGQVPLAYERFFMRQPMAQMVKRLRALGVEYLLACSRRYVTALEQIGNGALEPVQREGEFVLFRLTSPASRIEPLAADPLLFVHAGGITFREFAQVWFALPAEVRLPVLNAPVSFEALPPRVRERFRTVLVSVPDDGRGVGALLAQLRAEGKEVVLLSAARTPNSAAAVHVVPSLATARGRRKLRSVLREASVLRPTESVDVAGSVRQGEVLLHAHDQAVLLRYGYTPNVRAEGGVLFEATPAFLAVIPDGEQPITLRW